MLLTSFLKPINLSLEKLLLDPNNPRFAELGQEFDLIPERRFEEDKVQSSTFERMKDKRFEVAELRDTIYNLGFLPMDRLVVRKWAGKNPTDKYVVVEGNRRITALKWLMELHETGRSDLSDEQIRNYTNFEALLLVDDAPENSRWILPGLRHVSGIREWGAYQKARTIAELRKRGESPQIAAQSLGLSTRAANLLWRSFNALEQMKQDEEFGEFVEPSHYSYFEEVFKQPSVKNWLEWDDETREFKQKDKLHEFFTWILGEIQDNGQLSEEKKLPTAHSIRELSKIIGEPTALSKFRSKDGSLSNALTMLELFHKTDWLMEVIRTEKILSTLSVDIVKDLNEEQKDVLEKLKSRILAIEESNIKLHY